MRAGNIKRLVGQSIRLTLLIVLTLSSLIVGATLFDDATEKTSNVVLMHFDESNEQCHGMADDESGSCMRTPPADTAQRSKVPQYVSVLFKPPRILTSLHQFVAV